MLPQSATCERFLLARGSDVSCAVGHLTKETLVRRVRLLQLLHLWFGHDLDRDLGRRLQIHCLAGQAHRLIVFFACALIGSKIRLAISTISRTSTAAFT